MGYKVILTGLILVVIIIASLIVVSPFNIFLEEPDIEYESDDVRAGVEVNILQNENVDKIRINYEDDVIINETASTNSNIYLREGQGNYTILAKVEDTDEYQKIGSEYINYNSFVYGDINPDIGNPKVIARDGNGQVINSTVVDRNGEYEMKISNNNYNLFVNITSNKVYAGMVKENFNGVNNIDFKFDSNDRVSCNINGETRYVYYDDIPNPKITNPYQTYCLNELSPEYTLYESVDDSDNDGLSDFIQENKLGTDPLKEDTNDDGLDDFTAYRVADVDPLKENTVNDGFSDRFAYNEEDLDANRYNIRLKVHYMNTLSEPDLSKVEDSFEDMPINNKYGENGVNVDIDIAGSVESTSEDINIEGNRYKQYYNSLYDNNMKNDGYYHILIVESVDGRGTVGMTTAPNGGNGIIVEGIEGSYYINNRDDLTSTVIHEVGHQLGLLPIVEGSYKYGNEYKGIDSNKLSCSEYNSVMNYNCNLGLEDFNNGEPYDDYNIIKKYMNKTNPKNVD